MRKTIFILFTFVVMALTITAQPGATTSPADTAKRDAAIDKANTDGEAARTRGDYRAAIAIYDAAITADPTHVGTPILLMYKAISQMVLGQETYRKGLQPRDEAKIKEAAKLLREAADTAAKAVTGGRTMKYTGEHLYSVLLTRKDTVRLAAVIDRSAITAADIDTAFNDYFAVETKPAMLQDARLAFGELLYINNDLAGAQIQYEKVLAAAPKNPAALWGMARVMVGLVTEVANTALYQDAANYAHRFLQVAPANDPSRTQATDLLDYVKKEYNITPK